MHGKIARVLRGKSEPFVVFAAMDFLLFHLRRKASRARTFFRLTVQHPGPMPFDAKLAQDPMVLQG